MSEEKIKKYKRETEDYYKSIKEIYCPYFGDKITFNAKGLEHLKFKRKNHARSVDDQLIRLKLFNLAPEVLSLSKTLQGVSSRRVFESVRTNSRSEYKMVDAEYFEFVAILKNIRVKVVVKQIGNSPKYFWSIIPFWKISKNKNKKKMHSGNPEED
ncbi:MAG: hypothetical protein K9M15_02225 [Candidatus Marinimicrobia bacterium]|nr:hypothetical protein [Candidatus Neomarinimicrobiota bacterium]